MPGKSECADRPGEVTRASAVDGLHILPRGVDELYWDLAGLAVAVPFGLMFLWAAVMW